MLGIENLKKLTVEVAQLGNGLADVFADLDVNFKDMKAGFELIGTINDLSQLNFQEIKDEVADLDDSERKQLHDLFVANFNLANDTLEGVIEEGLSLVVSGASFIVGLLGMAKKIKK